MGLCYYVRLWFISRLFGIILGSQILCFNVSPPPSFSPRYLFTIIPFSICLPELYLFRSISSGFVYFFFHFPESLLYFIVLSASLIDITKRSPKITGALGDGLVLCRVKSKMFCWAEKIWRAEVQPLSVFAVLTQVYSQKGFAAVVHQYHKSSEASSDSKRLLSTNWKPNANDAHQIGLGDSGS